MLASVGHAFGNLRNTWHTHGAALEAPPRLHIALAANSRSTTGQMDRTHRPRAHRAPERALPLIPSPLVFAQRRGARAIDLVNALSATANLQSVKLRLENYVLNICAMDACALGVGPSTVASCNIKCAWAELRAAEHRRARCSCKRRRRCMPGGEELTDARGVRSCCRRGSRGGRSEAHHQ